jgi:hypothetical protein
MAIKYIKWVYNIKNGNKYLYQYFPFYVRLSKNYPNLIFGLKIYHLATQIPILHKGSSCLVRVLVGAYLPT